MQDRRPSGDVLAVLRLPWHAARYPSPPSLTPGRATMRLRFRTSAALLVAAVASGACATATPEVSPAPGHARYLYVWAGDRDGDASDFLAVYDVDPTSPTYRRVKHTVPVGQSRTHPHHLEYWLPPTDQLLFASGYGGERLFLFDISTAPAPTLQRTITRAPGFRYPHDMLRLANGHVLVSYLGTDNASADDGGIVEYDGRGDIVRSAGSADTAAHGQVRTYAMAALPQRDRLVSTSAPMHQDSTAHVVQVWELSTLRLMHTLRLPEGPAPHLRQMPFVPRVLADGETILLNTFGCGFYLVRVPAEALPQVEYVGSIADAFADCGVPVLAGNYWVTPIGKQQELVVFDVSRPTQPRVVSRLATDSTFRPHWLAADPGSDRIIVGGENGGEDRMLMARLDPATGRLTWDATFNGANGEVGISFSRESWPHGRTGAAFAHAALFR